MKRALVVWLSLAILLGLIVIIVEIAPKVEAPTTIIVDDDGTPGVDCNFTTIQEGINNANPGDVVFVKNGTYYENVVVDVMINLTGEDRNNTTIDAQGSGTVLKITSSWVNVSGFTIENAGGSYGLWFASSNNLVWECNITDNDYTGIYIQDGSNNNDMLNCNIINNTNYGILLYSDGNEIRDINISSGHNRHGIYIIGANDNIIDGNNITNNGGALSFYGGIYIDNGHRNIIANNDISNNDFTDIFIRRGSDNSIEHNNITSGNGNGIIIYLGNDLTPTSVYYNNTFRDNTIRYGRISLTNNNVAKYDRNKFINNSLIDGSDGIYLSKSKGNIISGNTIMNKITPGIRINKDSSDTVINKSNTIENCFMGIDILDSDNNTIEDNVIKNSSYEGIYLHGDSGSHNNKLVNNTIINNREGIFLSKSSNNTLDGNIIYQNRERGFRFEYSCNNKIIHNTIKDNEGYGIHICNSSHNNSIENHNDIINNSVGIFIGIYYSDVNLYTTILNNNITNNRGNGLFLYRSSDNSITGNNFSYNFNYGVHLYAESNNNDITDNEFYNNTEGGIYLRYSSDGNRIINNTITYGNYGIDLHHEKGGSVCVDNLIIDNTIISANYSLYLGYASDNHIYNTTITNPETYGLYVNRKIESNFANFIPRNNTCDGDTIYYFYDERDLKFEGPEDLSQHNVTNIGKVTFYASSNITIANKTISNGTIGIFIHSSDNITLEDNFISNLTQVGLYVENGYWHYISQNNIVDNEPIYYYTNDTGITVENLILDTVNVSNVGKITLAYCKDVLLKNNTVSNNDYGIFLWGCIDITMWDNNMSSPNLAGLFIEEGFHHYISQNNTANDQEVLYFVDIHGTESAPILVNTYHLTAKFNNLYHTNVGLISYVNCSYLIIENNTLFYNYGSGLFVASSFNITIRNNTANYNCNGVWLESSINTTITLNYFNVNKQVVNIHTGAGYGMWAGIHIRNCRSKEWNRNTITNNSEITSNKRGIYVESSRYDVISFHNQTINNNERAIYLDYSSPYIHDNHFYGGIMIDGERSNPIIENNTFKGGSIAIYHLSHCDRSAKIIGNTLDGFHLAAIYLMQNSSPEIGHNLITNVWADGITAYHDDSSPYIHNNTISHTGLMGVQLEDSNAIIENNTIFDVNQGINVNLNPHVPPWEYPYYGSNATIKDNVISKCYPKNWSYRGIGIFFAGFSTGIALNNTINETTHSGIRLNSGTTPWEIGENKIWDTTTGIHLLGSHPNLKVHNNTLNDTYEGITVEKNAFASLAIEYNNITDNERGVIAWISDFRFTDNLVTLNDYGIDVRGGSITTIERNIIESNIYGIRILEDSNPTIQNNFINWSTEYGIYADSSSPTIESNKFRNRVDRTDGFASYFDTCSNLTKVMKNTYMDSHRAIYLESTPALVENNDITLVVGNASRDDTIGIAVNGQSNEIIKNNIINKGDSGIRIENNSHATIVGNLIYNSSYFGISLLNSENITIYNNGIYSSLSYGIYLNNSNNALIYHNNIINNTIQAYDDQNTSSWDNGYPSGGNYWSDYDGVDYNSTQTQDVPPPDGLGDSPYTNILGWPGVQDDYPLMYPHVYRMHLNYGWNLISIPFIQMDTNIDIVLSSIEGHYNAIRYYDSGDALDLWKHKHIEKPSHLNDLSNINHTWGFWIHITEPDGVDFEYSGLYPRHNQTISLHPGWNLVGYPSLTNKNRTVGLNNLEFGTDVGAILWYNSATKTWHFMDENDYFRRGTGYWMHTEEDIVWQVPL